MRQFVGCSVHLSRLALAEDLCLMSFGSVQERSMCEYYNHTCDKTLFIPFVKIYSCNCALKWCLSNSQFFNRLQSKFIGDSALTSKPKIVPCQCTLRTFSLIIPFVLPYILQRVRLSYTVCQMQ